jgi:DNA/RNA-binding domain of Phe-tRNA-synthetase-like protein
MKIDVSLEFSDAWRAAYPGAAVGMLAMTSVTNSAPGTDFQARLRSIGASLRSRYAGRSRLDLESLPQLRPYVTHYRGFGKTYHVLLQLESVAFRGRSLRASESLVSAMFAVEVATGLLTAGHDLRAVSWPLLADVARRGEPYMGIGGKAIEVKPGDMMIRDREGILSTVLYGPDQRTRVLPETSSVVFTTYAPAGILDSDVDGHLRRIGGLVRVESPSANTILIAIARA